jgi:hypothetical protein
VSEYQYYEFLAVDRPLDAAELAAVRSLSTRARVTTTRFTNDYSFGSFGVEPRRMVERYYDAHLYLANWGTRRWRPAEWCSRDLGMTPGHGAAIAQLSE